MTDAGRPRRILLLIQQLTLGGSERQVCEMALALNRTRFSPHVGYFRPGGMRLEELKAAGVPLVQFPVRSFLSPANIAESVRALRRYVREHEIDVVHGFDPPGCLLAGTAAPWLRSIVTLTSQRNHQQVRTLSVRMAMRVCHRLVDGVVVNCEAMREHLVADERISRQRIHLCYNGLDTERFRRMAPPAGIVPDGALVVGSLCAMRPEKDLAVLVEAFAACQADDPRLFLLLVGSGSERERLQALASRLGVADRTRFEPMVSDVVPWLSLMDIFVLTSRFEALPNALMEAMACGCAAVSSRVGGTAELIEEGRSGLLFAAGDTPALVGHLRRLIGDPGLRSQFAKRAAARMAKDFSLEASATRLGTIYSDRLAARVSSRS